MKSSQNDQTVSADVELREEVSDQAADQVFDQGVAEEKPKGFRAVVRRFKHDLRVPLPGTEDLGRWGKIKARFKHLAKRYGWKLLVAVILYYLIRDTILYIIIPYLIASHIID